MLKMRLQRMGRKHDPSFRIIVTEKARGPKSGRYVDLVGNYNVKHGGVKIDGEKAKMWMDRGAQVSGTVWNLLVSEGIIEGKKVNVLPKKTVQKSEEDEAQETAAEAPAADDTASTDDAPAEDAASAEGASDESTENEEAESTETETPAEENAEAPNDTASDNEAEPEESSDESDEDKK